jgi:hypothetical protein
VERLQLRIERLLRGLGLVATGGGQTQNGKCRSHATHAEQAAVDAKHVRNSSSKTAVQSGKSNHRR